MSESATAEIPTRTFVEKYPSVLFLNLFVVELTWTIFMRIAFSIFDMALPVWIHVVSSIALWGCIISSLDQLKRSERSSYSWLEISVGVGCFALKAMICGVIMAFGYCQANPLTFILIVGAANLCLLSRD